MDRDDSEFLVRIFCSPRFHAFLTNFYVPRIRENSVIYNVITMMMMPSREIRIGPPHSTRYDNGIFTWFFYFIFYLFLCCCSLIRSVPMDSDTHRSNGCFSIRVVIFFSRESSETCSPLLVFKSCCFTTVQFSFFIGSLVKFFPTPLARLFFY